MNINVDMNINISALLEQKQALLRALNKAPRKDVELLQGLLNLLDYIHDKTDPPSGPEWILTRHIPTSGNS